MATQTRNTFNKSKVEDKVTRTGPRTFNIKISLTAIITVSVLFLICFGWSFVLGVMVGRDYDPETIMPQFSNQDQELTNEEIIALSDDPDQLTAKIEQSTQAELENTEVLMEDENDKIIEIEELNFSTSLKGKPGEGKLAPSVIAKNNAANDKIRDNAAKNQSSNKVVAKSNEAMPSTTIKMPQQIESQQARQAAPNKDIYDFVIQVATFKEVDAVDKLRAELEGHDLRTRMEKWKGEKSVFYSVFVVFRGTEAKAESLNKIFKKLRLGQALQKEKTLVEK